MGKSTLAFAFRSASTVVTFPDELASVRAVSPFCSIAKNGYRYIISDKTL